MIKVVVVVSTVVGITSVRCHLVRRYFTCGWGRFAYASGSTEEGHKQGVRRVRHESDRLHREQMRIRRNSEASADDERRPA